MDLQDLSDAAGGSKKSDQAEMITVTSPAPAVRIDHADARYAGVVLVDWMLGSACNYACSYCPKELHDGSISWQGEADILALYDRLAEHYQRDRGRSVWLQFTGGEPTMHPRFLSIVEAAAGFGFQVSVISNASRTLRFWRRVRPLLDAAILTYHPEFVKLAPFVDVLRLLSEEMPVHVNVTMPPDRFDAVYAEADAIAAAVPTCTVALKPLRVGFRSQLYPYTDEQRARLDTRLTRVGHPEAQKPRGILRVTRQDGRTFDAHVHDLVLTDTNRWKGWLCHAGLESLRINGDGRVTRAVCSAGGDLGQIGGAVQLPDMPVTCDREVCACISDMLITKVRIA